MFLSFVRLILWCLLHMHADKYEPNMIIITIIVDYFFVPIASLCSFFSIWITIQSASYVDWIVQRIQEIKCIQKKRYNPIHILMVEKKCCLRDSPAEACTIFYLKPFSFLTLFVRSPVCLFSTNVLCCYL